MKANDNNSCRELFSFHILLGIAPMTPFVHTSELWVGSSSNIWYKIDVAVVGNF